MACPHATGSGTLSRLFCQMPSTLPLCIHTTLPGYQPFQYKVVLIQVYRVDILGLWNEEY